MEEALDILQAKYKLSDRERKLLQFTFVGLAYDITKLILLFLYFAYIQQIPSFLFCITLQMILRQNQGGLHLKHYSSCLVLSFLYLFLAICIFPIIFSHLEKAFALLLLYICATTNYFIGPIINPKIYTKYKNIDYIQKSKNIIMFICLIYSVFCFFTIQLTLTQQGLWVIVLHTLQILFAYIKRERRPYHD